MTAYRRHRVPGGTYFSTVNLYDRRSKLLVEHIDILRDAVRKVRTAAPFHIDASVVPDHLHCVWTMPDRDENFSARWQAIKTAFSKQIPGGEFRSTSRQCKGERALWQRRFWGHSQRRPPLVIASAPKAQAKQPRNLPIPAHAANTTPATVTNVGRKSESASAIFTNLLPSRTPP